MSKTANAFKLADKYLLTPYDLGADELDKVFRKLMKHELDYAVQRLTRPIGSEPMGTADTTAPGRSRGWIAPNGDAAVTLLIEDAPAFVLEHPEGAPLQLAAGKFLEVRATRVRHDVNTAPGSSGSPCFDAHLELVALHNGGGLRGAAEHYQAVPMAAIVAACQSDGLTFPAPAKPR